MELKRYALVFILASMGVAQEVTPPAGGGGGGSGTVGNCATAGGVAVYSAAGTVIGCLSNFTADSGGNVSAAAFSSGGPTVVPGTGGVNAYKEGTVPGTCSASAVDCVYGDSTQHGLLANFNNVGYLPLVQGPSSNTPNKVAVWSGTNGGKIIDSDSRDAKIVPFAAAPAGTAASGISYATGQWTPAPRSGSNNIGAALQAIPSTGATLQFLIELPADWDTAAQPFLRLQYASGANTSGTVIWTVSSACTKSDGSVTDDPAFVAESAFATQTMAAANRSWAQTGQFTHITSGNNCIPGSPLIIKVVLSGTASSAINAYQAVLTIPTIPNPAQAN